MISSFFGKTQPIHYIIVLGFLFILFWLGQVSLSSEVISRTDILPNLLYSLVLLVTIYLADLMVKKGKMTDQSAFFLLFMALQFLLFPDALNNHKGIWAHFFLLFAVQRLLDSKNLKNIKHKVFDGSLLICIASLFFTWALLFLVLVVFTINTYAQKSFKTWLSGLAGIFTSVLLAYVFLLIIGGTSNFLEYYSVDVSLQKLRETFSGGLSIKILGYVIFIVAFGLVDFIKYRTKGGGKIILFRFMLLYFMLALLVALLDSSPKNYLILAFIPASIFISNYLQTIKRTRFKETFLTIVVLLTFGLALFEFLV